MSTTSADGHLEHQANGFVSWAMRWITTTNHKDIGTLYLVFALAMFFVGGAMALYIRAELAVPGMQFANPHFFNQMTTVHALVMVFGMIMPAFAGFANWFIPLMIGAPRTMAASRMAGATITQPAWLVASCG
jgi:cytochrome c oxidase subunit 1